MLRTAPLILFLAIFAAAAPCIAVPLKPNDIIAVDATLDAVFVVDPVTGNRTIFSDSSTGTGPNFQVPVGVAVASDGDLLVADFSAAALFKVDRVSGNRTILSDSTHGSGTNFVDPRYVTVRSDGSILVADDATSTRAVFAVDPDNGNRTIISSSSMGTGPLLTSMFGIDVNSAGEIFVAHANPDPDLNNVLEINPVTGDRTVVSNNNTMGSGPDFDALRGIALDDNGAIYVSAIGSANAIFQVDPITGDRSILSDTSNGTGTNFSHPTSIAYLNSDQLLVDDGNLDALFLVDILTGDRTILSDSTHGTGVNFTNIQGITSIPASFNIPEPSTGSLVVFSISAVIYWRRRHRRA